MYKVAFVPAYLELLLHDEFGSGKDENKVNTKFHSHYKKRVVNKTTVLLKIQGRKEEEGSRVVTEEKKGCELTRKTRALV